MSKRYGPLITPVKAYGKRFGFDDYWTSGKRIQVRRLTKAATQKAYGDLSALVANGRKDLAQMNPVELAQFREWKRARAASIPLERACVLFEAVKRTKSWRHVDSLRLDLSHFRAYAGDSILLSEITTPMIENFLDARPVGERRKFNLLSSVRALFRWAKRQGYLPDETTAAEKVEPIKKKPGKIFVFSPAVMRVLLENVLPDFLPWLATAGFAMVRQGEIYPGPRSRKRALMWEDFRWEKRHIDLHAETSKTGERRLVPIPDNLAAWLSPWRDARGPICKRQPAAHETQRLGKVIGGWRNNMLRDSAITYRCAILKNLAQVAYEAGNSVSMIRRSYHEAREESEGLEYYAIMPERPANIITLGHTSQ